MDKGRSGRRSPSDGSFRMSRRWSFNVPLDEDSFHALRLLAHHQYRDRRRQAAVVIRDRLIDLGYLTESGETTQETRVGLSELNKHD